MSATLVKIITLRCRATTNLKKDDGLGDGIPLNWPCFLFVFPLFSTKKKKKEAKITEKRGEKNLIMICLSTTIMRIVNS